VRGYEEYERRLLIVQDVGVEVSLCVELGVGLLAGFCGGLLLLVELLFLRDYWRLLAIAGVFS